MVELSSWHRIGALMAACALVPVVRPGWDGSAPHDLRGLAGEDHVDAMLARRVHIPLVDVSSTELRERLGQGRSARYLAPDLVLEYVARHGLYAAGQPNRKDLPQCRKKTCPW